MALIDASQKRIFLGYLSWCFGVSTVHISSGFGSARGSLGSARGSAQLGAWLSSGLDSAPESAQLGARLNSGLAGWLWPTPGRLALAGSPLASGLPAGLLIERLWLAGPGRLAPGF